MSSHRPRCWQWSRTPSGARSCRPSRRPGNAGSTKPRCCRSGSDVPCSRGDSPRVSRRPHGHGTHGPTSPSASGSAPSRTSCACSSATPVPSHRRSPWRWRCRRDSRSLADSGASPGCAPIPGAARLARLRRYRHRGIPPRRAFRLGWKSARLGRFQPATLALRRLPRQRPVLALARGHRVVPSP